MVFNLISDKSYVDEGHGLIEGSTGSTSIQKLIYGITTKLFTPISQDLLVPVEMIETE